MFNLWIHSEKEDLGRWSKKGSFVFAVMPLSYIGYNLADLFLIFVVCPFFILFFLAVGGYMVYTHLLHPGPVYFPSDNERVRKMLKLAGVGRGDVVVDLGSGDGRILIAAARLGAKAVGYEVDPVLVYQSRKNIKRAGVKNLAKVHLRSMWRADYNEATVITVYLFPKFMKRLQKLIEAKLTHLVLVVSNDYQFPDEKYIKRSGNCYLYKFEKSGENFYT